MFAIHNPCCNKKKKKENEQVVNKENFTFTHCCGNTTHEDFLSLEIFRANGPLWNSALDFYLNNGKKEHIKDAYIKSTTEAETTETREKKDSNQLEH